MFSVFSSCARTRWRHWNSSQSGLISFCLGCHQLLGWTHRNWWTSACCHFFIVSSWVWVSLLGEVGIWCWELCLCSWVRWIFENRSLWPVGSSSRFFSSLWCGCCRNQQMISIQFCCSSSCSFCCLVKISSRLCFELPCCAFVDDSYRVLLIVSLDFT